ncbi:hypothetical protein KKH96_02300 [Patescibacteria group bacterium]|nr:hypothetical protein [Patescibacteria group bacterium]
MEDRYLILFKEIIAKRILEGEINLRNPRRSILSLVVEFREIYGFSLFSKFTYSLLVEEFIGVVDQNAFDLDLERMRKELISRHSSKSWVTPAMLEGACRAEYRHLQMLGDDY